MDMQRLSRDIENLKTCCDLKLANDGKIVFSERPGITWKQQWEIDRFRAIVASDAQAKEILRRYIRETIEVPRENRRRSEEVAGQKPVSVSPPEARSTQLAAQPSVSHQITRTINDSEPTSVEIDIADAMLLFIAEQPGPVSEDDILAAVDGDAVLKRNVLYRLAMGRIVERLKGGGYRVPDWPRKDSGLPDHCPAKKGGQAIGNCVLAAPLMARFAKEGIVSASTGCPLRRVCGPTR